MEHPESHFICVLSDALATKIQQCAPNPFISRTTVRPLSVFQPPAVTLLVQNSLEACSPVKLAACKASQSTDTYPPAVSAITTLGKVHWREPLS